MSQLFSDSTELPQIISSLTNRGKNRSGERKMGTSTDCVTLKYNAHCGYSKRFHNRSNLQSRLKELLKECSTLSIKSFQCHSKRSPKSLKPPPTYTRKQLFSTRPSPKKEHMSQAIKSKYLKIFSENYSEAESNKKLSLSIPKVLFPVSAKLSSSTDHPLHEAKSVKVANKIKSIGLRSVRLESKHKASYSMAFKNPERTNITFFQQYLRLIMRRGMELPIRRKYMEYLKQANEEVLGKDFLLRMKIDITHRELSKSIS